MRSDNTRVPPVTAERSPPDSRMTGADSPVIADSSTLAIPSTTSPSPGMICPASTTTMSPCCSATASTASSWYVAAVAPAVHPLRRRATVSCLARRSVAAWALPRSSATASARFANSTVSQSQAVINQANTDGLMIASTVVNAAPTSTMNMTGFRHRVAGFSLRSAPGSAVQSWLGCRSPAPTRREGRAVSGTAADVTDISLPPSRID